MYCIVELQTSLIMLILLYICPIFFLSIVLIMKVFFEDVSETLKARVVIFGMQDDTCNNVLYCETANLPSHVFSSLYLSNFLTFHTLNNEFFRQRCL